MNIDGTTKIIGFLGSTYKTSPLYTMYNGAFEALGLHYIYVPLAPIGPKEAMDGVRQLGLHAVGVTIPYKTAVIPFLDALDDTAKKVGAVNAVVNRNGKLIGGNTDGIGAIAALEEVTKLKRKNVILLGAGGAARAIVCALANEGARVTVLNRTWEKAKEVARLVGGDFGSIDDLAEKLVHADILIHATSVGMAPNSNDSLVDKKLLSQKLIVMELVRDPKETKLISDAKNAGCRVILGERMLLYQAVSKFKMYTGVSAPIDIMEKALKEGK